MGKSAEQLKIEKSLLWATLADCYEALLSMVKDSLPEDIDLRVKIVLARHALDMTRDLDMVIDPNMAERITEQITTANQIMQEHEEQLGRVRNVIMSSLELEHLSKERAQGILRDIADILRISLEQEEVSGE